MGFRLFLLGVPRVERDGQAVQASSRKGMALLAYLAVESGRPYSRDELAALLWPDFEQTRARAAVRRTLSRLNGALGAEWAIREGDRVRLNPAGINDVAQFQNHLQQGELDQALALYQGDFMAGFTLNDSPAFDTWQRQRADQLYGSLLDALEARLKQYHLAGEREAALELGQRLVGLDPLHEDGHRHLMRLYAEMGQRVSALRQYEKCRQVLQDELGVWPNEETERLFRAIKQGKIVVVEPSALVEVADLPEAEELSLVEPKRLAEETGRQQSAAVAQAKTLLVVASVVVGILLMGIIYFWREAQQSEEVAQVATAGLMATESLALSGTDVQGALVLAQEAFVLEPSVENRYALYQVLNARPDHFITALPQRDEPVRRVAISEAGLLAVGWADGWIGIFDGTTYEQVAELDGHTRAVTSLAFSPITNLLASGGQDGLMYLWSMADFVAVGQPLDRHTGAVASLAFSPDGSRLVSAGEAHLLVWDMETGQSTPPLAQPPVEMGARAMAFHPAGSRLFVADGREVFEFDMDSSLLRIARGSDFIHSLAVSPSGRTLVYGGRDRSLQVVDLEQDDFSFPLGLADNWVEDVVFDPAGGQVLSTDNEGGIWVRSLFDPGGPPRLLGRQEGAVWEAAFFPDGERLVTVGEDGLAVVWDVNRPDDLHVSLEAASVSNIIGVGWSPDGGTLWSGQDNGVVSLWSSGTWEAAETHERLVGRNLSVWGLHPAGHLLATTHESTLHLVDPATFEPLTEPLVQPSDQILSVAFSSLDSWLATGNLDGSVYVWDTETFVVREPALVELGSPVNGVAFDPAGVWLATGTEDGRVRLWEVASGERLSESSPYASPIAHMQVSGDGARLAVGHNDGSLALWSVEGGVLEEVERVTLFGESISVLTFSPDGAWVVLGNWAGELLVWSVPAGEGFLLDTHHTRGIASLAFSPDGRWLASGSWDNTTQVWNLDVAAWQRAACVAGNVLDCELAVSR